MVAKAIAAPGKILSSLASRAFANQLPPIEAVTRPTKTKTTPKPKPKAQAKKAGQLKKLDLDSSTLSLNQIGAAPFLSIANKKDNKTFACSVKEIDQLLDWHNSNHEVGLTVNAIEPGISENISNEELLRRIPIEHHARLQAFRKRKISELPPHREYDYRIELEDRQKIGNWHCPIYRMSR
ncbi:hypothetical protein XPA_000987 [Xanthoria parietina]